LSKPWRGERCSRDFKLLATCEVGKEEKAEVELLDALLRRDRAAEVVRTGFPGVLLVRTYLIPQEALELVRSMEMAYVKSIVALELIVPAELDAVKEACLRLAREEGLGPGVRFAVRCRRRGRALPSSHQLEIIVGKAIREATGAEVDLEEPDVVFRIEVVGDLVGVGLERHHYFRSPLPPRLPKRAGGRV